MEIEKLLKETNSCWKCGSDPIIEVSKTKTILKCPNEECNNELILTDYPTIEDGFDIWNKIYNCKPLIPKNVHYLNTCNKCIHRLNCILARDLHGDVNLMSITCDRFERDLEKEDQIKLTKLIEGIIKRMNWKKKKMNGSEIIGRVGVFFFLINMENNYVKRYCKTCL